MRATRTASTLLRWRERLRAGAAVRGGATGGVAVVVRVVTEVSWEVAGCGGVSRSGDTGTSRPGQLDLVAQRLPDPAVEVGELRRQADLLDLARTGQVDGDDLLDGRRAGGHHDDGVRQRDGLGEVVGHEHDGRA